MIINVQQEVVDRDGSDGSDGFVVPTSPLGDLPQAQALLADAGGDGPWRSANGQAWHATTFSERDD